MMAIKEIHSIIDQTGVKSLLLYWKGYLLKPKIVKIPESFSYKCYVNAIYKNIPEKCTVTGYGTDIEEAYIVFAENLAMACDSIVYLWIESERRFV